MRYKLFGNHTGLRVSEFALGTGNFGTGWGYGSTPDIARPIFDGYAEAGEISSILRTVTSLVSRRA